MGKGSEFSFSISMLNGELHELPETKTNAKEISFTGVTILLAEDNDLNAEIAIELLQTQGRRFIGLKTESKHWNCFAIVRKEPFK